MINIYCIEDINGLKYIGSTKETLRRRFKRHTYRKNDIMKSSSNKLDLDNSRIYLLEECEENKRDEREQFYIRTIDCVNIIKNIGNYDNTKYKKWYDSWAEYKDPHNLHKIKDDLFC
jgi:predicted GIY-YIG superfamily endonuclease